MGGIRDMGMGVRVEEMYLMVVRVWESRRRLRDVYPLPGVRDCYLYAVTEVGEYVDAVLRRERVDDKRNCEREMDERWEFGQAGWMICSGLMQEVGVMGRWWEWGDEVLVGECDWVDVMRCLLDVLRGGSGVSALSAWWLACEGYGWDPMNLIDEVCEAVERKYGVMV